MDKCLGECVEACRFNDTSFAWFFVVAFLFYALKLAVVQMDLKPKVKTAMAFGLLKAFELLMIGGIIWFWIASS